MAAPASPAGLEEPQAVPFAVIERTGVSSTEAVDLAVPQKQCPLEARQRLAEIGGRDAIRKRFFKAHAVLLIGLEALDDVIDFVAHFQRVFDGFERLGLQAGLPAIPEQD